MGLQISVLCDADHTRTGCGYYHHRTRLHLKGYCDCRRHQPAYLIRWGVRRKAQWRIEKSNAEHLLALAQLANRRNVAVGRRAV